MAKKTYLERRLLFRQNAIERLYDAYEKLLAGGVKSYMIDDRQLTRLDLPELWEEIQAMEQEIDQLEAAIAGTKPRKAFGVLPRDW